MILLKVSFIDTQNLDNILQKKEKLTEDNISFEKIKFQIEGNTIVHLFALNFNCLSFIINFIIEYNKKYLTMILVKNKQNISPLDITIENESPRCTELMLRSISLLGSGSYSSLIYERFDKLLGMNLKAFYEYLDS